MKNCLVNHSMPLNGIECYKAYQKSQMTDDEYRECWYTFMIQHLRFDLRACTCTTCMENIKIEDIDRYPCGQNECWARAYARQIN